MNHPNAPDAVRLPPQSIESEQSLLGGLLIDNGAIDRIGSLTPGQFYRDDHRRIFRHIIALIGRSEPADITTVAESLNAAGEIEQAGGLTYLVELAAAVPSTANIHAYARNIRDRALQRALLEAVADITEHVHGLGTAAEKADYAQSRVMALAEGATVGEPRMIREALIDTLGYMEHRWSTGASGISTGFADLDRRLGGGMERQDLIIVAGRPSMGKTSFALQIGSHVAASNDLPVAVFSMEMSAQQLTLRELSALSRISTDRLRNGGLTEDEDARMEAAVAKLDGLKVYIDDAPELTVTEVRTRARAIKRKHGLALVVIDYLQLMSGEGDNRNEVISGISRGLKAMAKELGVPVIALSQLSRKCEDRPNKRPMNSDLRDSGAIEQDADVIVFVYRDEVYHPDSPDAGIAEINIGKNRNGPTGMVRLAFLGEFTRFENLAAGYVPPPREAPKKRRYEL
jgi:replicative DNA helicase